MNKRTKERNRVPFNPRKDPPVPQKTSSECSLYVPKWHSYAPEFSTAETIIYAWESEATPPKGMSNQASSRHAILLTFFRRSDYNPIIFSRHDRESGTGVAQRRSWNVHSVIHGEGLSTPNQPIENKSKNVKMMTDDDRR